MLLCLCKFLDVLCSGVCMLLTSCKIICFDFCRFTAHILNQDLLPKSLCELGKEVMGKHWTDEGLSDVAKTLTFGAIDGYQLRFPGNCQCRPYKRILCFLAHLATKKATKKGDPFRIVDFEDFWSETDQNGVTLAYKEQVTVAVQAWMDGNI